MNCRGASRRLSAYIDNDLSPGIRQGVDEHLKYCVSCRRKLSEFQAIVVAAQQLTPMAVSRGFEDRVFQAIHSRQETREILSSFRYRLTLAGVAFMVTSAAIFFVVGPPASTTLNSFAGRSDSITTSAQALDFYTHPETKVKSFPIPEGADPGKFASEENLVRTDSIIIDNFNMPGVQKVNENINNGNLR